MKINLPATSLTVTQAWNGYICRPRVPVGKCLMRYHVIMIIRDPIVERSQTMVSCLK